MSAHSIPEDIRREWMRTLLSAQKPRHSLSQPLYCDETLFNLEMETLVEAKWLFAGLECEIAAPGQFMTVTVGRSSIIVCRNRAGELRAFYNSCRHRGSQVCDADKGKRAAFVCPYHQWSYDLDGKLVRAPNMPDGFDPAGYDLRAVPIRSAAGIVFICLADTPPDFADFQAAIEPAIAPHRLTSAKVVHEITLNERANWKLVWENARECDHCAAGHPELMRTLQLFNFENPWDDPYISAFWRRCESARLPSITKDGNGFRVGRVPFQPGQLSITMDGQPAVRKRLGDWPDQDIGSLRWAQYPSVFSHIHADYAIFVQIMPVAPELTRVTCKWVVHEDAVEGVDYDLERLVEVWRETNAQDLVFCERNQKGVNSKGYQPGPYAEPSEFGVWTFIDWYRSEMAKAVA